MLPTLVLPPDICSAPDETLDREWLVTNGLGGYASSSISGAPTRRYHGLLVAALRPPVERTVMLAKLEERVEVDGQTIDLSTNEWHDGTLAPRGFERLQGFRLEMGLPVWQFALPQGSIEKRVWMPHQENTTCISYRLEVGTTPVRLRAVCLTAFRDYHHETQGASDWKFAVEPSGNGWSVEAFPGARKLELLWDSPATLSPIGEWYWRFLHRRERERGLDCLDDSFAIGEFVLTLEPGNAVTLRATAEFTPDRTLDAAHSRKVELDRRTTLIEQSPGAKGGASELGSTLTLAADQFLVRRQDANVEEHGATVIAGYHWFCDWGRDTMISLPGLCLSTGRVDEAASILRTFRRYLDQGMLPNRFPDLGEQPEYNTVDATLWYFNAIGAYTHACGNLDLVRELYGALNDVVAWHERGTRFDIGVDARDGLLRAGVPGAQLSWMDAKIGDWVVTPRHGKPVEINALWYHALCLMTEWSWRLGEPAAALRYQQQARRVYASFNARYWNPATACLFDVVDGPAGDDGAVRPNQLFAVALSNAVLDPRHWADVVEKVKAVLLIPAGIRTLAPGSPGYVGRYEGGPQQRDASYHQGTAWGWLLGAYEDAHRRAYPHESSSLLAEGLQSRLLLAGVGSLSEISDAEPPFTPRGCIAQAWSVAEALRSL
jgi:predicted glycogen debranching enzyme